MQNYSNSFEVRLGHYHSSLSRNDYWGWGIKSIYCYKFLNPGALFVALSRAKTAGGHETTPDFAWHPSILVNTDRLCHNVDTPTTRARQAEILRIKTLSNETFRKFEKNSEDCCIKRFIEKCQAGQHFEE